MKVAVFMSHDETIILAVKGRTQSSKDIDGYNKWFGQFVCRNVKDFNVTLCHIGTGSGIYITTEMHVSKLDNEIDIADWFND